MLFALLYVGGNVNPRGNLRDLPVALVNADTGADAGGHRVNLGEQVVSGIEKAAEGDKSIDWQIVSREEADKRLGRGKVFGALVIPKDFSATVTALVAPPSAPQAKPAPPTLTVLTNQAAGSIGSSMSSQAAQKAAHAASAQIGQELLKQGAAQKTPLPTAAQLKLADPVTVTVADGHPSAPAAPWA